MSGFVTAILLSAGKSTRMGYPKALLDWQGIPLIRYQVENLINFPGISGEKFSRFPGFLINF